MTKKAILAVIKEANIMVDKMANLDTHSKEYQAINVELGYTLDCLTEGRGFTLHLSKRTGHYYVRFF